MERYGRVGTTVQAPDDPNVTAVTMRGLNRQVTRDGLLMLLYHAAQHLDRPYFDFVYLPWAMRKACNIGLAFINFETHAACMDFFEALQRAPELLMGFDVRYIGPASLQGRGPNLEDTVAKRGTGILYADDAPLVFNGGTQCDLLQVVALELPHLWAQLEAPRGRPRPRYTGQRNQRQWQGQEVIPGASAARAEYVERLMAHPQGIEFMSRQQQGSGQSSGSASALVEATPRRRLGRTQPEAEAGYAGRFQGSAHAEFRTWRGRGETNSSPEATSLPLPSKLTQNADSEGELE